MLFAQRLSAPAAECIVCNYSRLKRIVTEIRGYTKHAVAVAAKQRVILATQVPCLVRFR
jgi:hypothetical protein